MKTVGKILLTLILVLALAVGGLLGWLTLSEYKPDAVESLVPSTDAKPGTYQPLRADKSLTVLSWNIGYAGLGRESDFFMDGGEDTRSADEATVERYLSGIEKSIKELEPDLVLLQEVDRNSARTFGVNEGVRLRSGNSVFALNYSCPFVPIPFPPIGKVSSGLLAYYPYTVERAERISLPCPFTWPMRVANLKRCLLVNYLPIQGSEAQLVLVDLHLEAYDDGEGKIAQTRQLTEFIESEYKKGNYVIAGGDFNQVFPGSLELYPNTHPDNWLPGVLDESALPAGFRYAYDLTTPTCRLLNQPYDPSDTVNTQYYVIDGFILSPNVKLESVESVDLGFENSDHNPVKISISLQ